MTARTPRTGGRRPSVASYARLRFPAELTDGLDSLSDHEAWIDHARVEHVMVQIAAKALTRDDVQSAAFVMEIGLNDTRTMLDTLHGMEQRYHALGELMATAHTRTLGRHGPRRHQPPPKMTA